MVRMVYRVRTSHLSAVSRTYLFQTNESRKEREKVPDV